jgi:DNA polymerase I-like protein with 3'-5' exonuclease and polymerase domains
MDPDFEQLAREGWFAFQRDQPSLVAWDTETTGLEWSDEAFCVTAAWYNADGGVEAHYFELVKLDTYPLTSSILRTSNVWVGHNLKFDIHRAINGSLVLTDDVEEKELHDTEALAHLDDEHRPKGLKTLAVNLLDITEETIEVPIKTGPNKGQTKLVPKEQYELEQAKKWAKKEYGLTSVKDVGYHLLPRGVVVPYAIKDAEFTLRLYTLLRPRVERFSDLWSLYQQEMRLTRGFTRMESKGLGVNSEYVQKKIKEYSRRVLEIEARVESIVGKPVRSGKMTEKEKKLYFNPNSPDQIASYLQRAGFSPESTDEAALSEIDHPFARAVLDLRSDNKILNTYLRGIRKGVVDGVFHPSIRQHGTVTGRTSSGGERGD